MTEETETVAYDPPVDDECDHEENTLTMNDRCDNCGAQAYVQAFFGESSLLFLCTPLQRVRRKNFTGCDNNF